MKSLVLVAAITWTGFWLTPDQQGWRHFRRGEYAEAAKVFRDPLWQGAAWYRAGEFKKAAQIFGRCDSAEGFFNQGNAWLMHGDYEAAVRSYEQALVRRPDWTEAVENRALAEARGKLVEEKGGDLGDQKQGADAMVFNKDQRSGGQSAQIEGGQEASDAAVQAMWLRRVQTRPADFLRAKFAYQASTQEVEK